MVNTVAVRDSPRVLDEFVIEMVFTNPHVVQMPHHLGTLWQQPQSMNPAADAPNRCSMIPPNQQRKPRYNPLSLRDVRRISVAANLWVGSLPPISSPFIRLSDWIQWESARFETQTCCLGSRNQPNRQKLHCK